MCKCPLTSLSFNLFCHYLLFVQAPSKDAVRQICTESYPAGAFKCQSVVETTANALSVSNSEAMQVGSCHLIYLVINIPSPRHQMYVFCEKVYDNQCVCERESDVNQLFIQNVYWS